MAYRHKHGRRTYVPYTEALQDAHQSKRNPQPLCEGRSAEFVDYETGQHPDEETAAAMCAPCPLFEVCQTNAKQQKPVHGVWGGIAWIDRKQAHLQEIEPPAEAEIIELRVIKTPQLALEAA